MKEIYIFPDIRRNIMHVQVFTVQLVNSIISRICQTNNKQFVHFPFQLSRTNNDDEKLEIQQLCSINSRGKEGRQTRTFASSHREAVGALIVTASLQRVYIYIYISAPENWTTPGRYDHDNRNHSWSRDSALYRPFVRTKLSVLIDSSVDRQRGEARPLSAEKNDRRTVVGDSGKEGG